MNRVNRRPIIPDVTEAKYSVHVTCLPRNVSEVRNLLASELDRAQLPGARVRDAVGR